MFIARTNTSAGGPVLVLGLSEANIQRLKANDMIRLDRQSHGEVMPEDLTIIIAYTESEEKALEVFAPLIGPETRVEVHNRATGTVHTKKGDTENN